MSDIDRMVKSVLWGFALLVTAWGTLIAMMIYFLYRLALALGWAS